MRPVKVLFQLLFWPPILLTPLLGVWLASSWAAWANGPRWSIVLAGALLFPILPLLWELWAEARRRKKLRRLRENAGFISRMRVRMSNERLTSFFDRMLIRTLVLNGSFLVGLLYGFPQQTLTAVGARGDWMLDDVSGAYAARSRAAIRAVSDRLQNYNGDFIDNEFEDTEALPELDIESVGAVRSVSTTAQITIELPPGATAQLDQHVFSESTTVTVPIRPTSIGVTFEDGRKLSCPLDPTVGTATLDGDALAGTPCEQLVAPDPTWRPAIHLVDQWRRFDDVADVILGERIVAPEDVVRVQRNDPWLRIQVNDAATVELCKATTNQGQSIAVVVQGKPRFVRMPHEASCDGYLPIDTDNPFEREHHRAEDPDAGSGTAGWPFADEPDPRLESIPTHRLASIAGLGKWIRLSADTEQERARLVHDWVAVNIRYDVDSLKPGKRAPQDADTVFRRKTGVCAGYANLVRSLGRAAGLEVVYLTGNVRDKDGGLAGSSHAWNAIKVDGSWLLMDATWDSGFNGENGFEFRYRSAYLFPPPEVFRRDHLPTKEPWQLSKTPISRGDFLRQDRMTVAAAAHAIELIDPATPQVSASDRIAVTLKNPKRLHMTATLSETRCKVDQGATVKVHCPVPRGGNHELRFFAKPGQRAGSYPYIGGITVQSAR